MNTRPNDDFDCDIEILKFARREDGGAWIIGRIDGEYRFDALVFADHAQAENCELDDSRISKLWIARDKGRDTVFHFDRGLDVPAADPHIRSIVAFLCGGLANLLHGR